MDFQPDCLSFIDANIVGSAITNCDQLDAVATMMSTVFTCGGDLSTSCRCYAPASQAEAIIFTR